MKTYKCKNCLVEFDKLTGKRLFNSLRERDPIVIEMCAACKAENADKVQRSYELEVKRIDNTMKMFEIAMSSIKDDNVKLEAIKAFATGSGRGGGGERCLALTDWLSSVYMYSVVCISLDYRVYIIVCI